MVKAQCTGLSAVILTSTERLTDNQESVNGLMCYWKNIHNILLFYSECKLQLLWSHPFKNKPLSVLILLSVQQNNNSNCFWVILWDSAQEYLNTLVEEKGKEKFLLVARKVNWSSRNLVHIPSSAFVFSAFFFIASPVALAVLCRVRNMSAVRKSGSVWLCALAELFGECPQYMEGRFFLSLVCQAMH